MAYNLQVRHTRFAVATCNRRARRHCGATSRPRDPGAQVRHGVGESREPVEGDSGLLWARTMARPSGAVATISNIFSRRDAGRSAQLGPCWTSSSSSSAPGLILFFFSNLHSGPPPPESERCHAECYRKRQGSARMIPLLPAASVEVAAWSDRAGRARAGIPTARLELSLSLMSPRCECHCRGILLYTAAAARLPRLFTLFVQSVIESPHSWFVDARAGGGGVRGRGVSGLGWVRCLGAPGVRNASKVCGGRAARGRRNGARTIAFPVTSGRSRAHGADAPSRCQHPVFRDPAQATTDWRKWDKIAASLSDDEEDERVVLQRKITEEVRHRRARPRSHAACVASPNDMTRRPPTRRCHELKTCLRRTARCVFRCRRSGIRLCPPPPVSGTPCEV